jgi:hypothetical protein
MFFVLSLVKHQKPILKKDFLPRSGTHLLFRSVDRRLDDDPFEMKPHRPAPPLVGELALPDSYREHMGVYGVHHSSAGPKPPIYMPAPRWINLPAGGKMEWR